ncbi:MAG: ChaN family lipoprotein [Candidatus Krumholzibacteria bacterium]|nr:ChaN family lipoprotein [Candidatus Krumholzibacteria bacterium]
MPQGKMISAEIAEQRRLIQRMKCEIFGIDKTSRSSYIKDFLFEFSTYDRVCTTGEVLERAARSDIVFFGDYHPLEESQQWVERLMTELVARDCKVVLAMEMLYVQQQEQLDRWMKGTLSEEEFLEQIDYKTEWGFDWGSFKRIFELAKDPFIPIFCIDAEPRDHLRYIRQRDKMIANRIKNIRRFFPDYLILVMIGESHLASGHLPLEIEKVCDEKFHRTIIVQNMDEIYWSLLQKGREHIEAVRIDEDKYCVFNASPIVKYQSYRRIIDRWIEGEEADSFVPVLGEMVSYILSFLIGPKKTLHVNIGGNDFESLDDIFPEIHCRQTFTSFASFLRSQKMSQLAVVSVIESLRRYGVSYVPGLNMFLILKYASSSAAIEASRFVLSAMRARMGKWRGRRKSVEERFYEFVLEETLSFVGAKIVDPTIDCKRMDPLLQVIDGRGVVRKPVAGFSLQETRAIVRMLAYHFRRDRSRSGIMRVTEPLRAIHRLGIKKRQLIVKALGHTLGEAVHDARYSGLVSKEEIRGLFEDRTDYQGAAKKIYSELVGRVKPFRGDWKTLRRS